MEKGARRLGVKGNEVVAGLAGRSQGRPTGRQRSFPSLIPFVPSRQYTKVGLRVPGFLL